MRVNTIVDHTPVPQLFQSHPPTHPHTRGKEGLADGQSLLDP